VQAEEPREIVSTHPSRHLRAGNSFRIRRPRTQRRQGRRFLPRRPGLGHANDAKRQCWNRVDPAGPPDGLLLADY